MTVERVETSYLHTPDTLAQGVGFLAIGEVMREGEDVVDLPGGYKLITYFDGPEYENLTQQVVDGRDATYKRENIWRPDAQADREDEIRGSHVEILAVIDPTTKNVVASMRKVHASLSELPSFKKFDSEGAFTDEQRDDLMQLAKYRPVVELGSLWKDNAYGAELTTAMYKKAFQDSYAKGEAWLMGAIDKERISLKRQWGKSLVHDVGSPVVVHDSAAVEGLRINPLVIDPVTFPEDMATEITEARNAGNIRTALADAVMLWYFLDGALGWRQRIGVRAVMALMEL